MTAKRKRRPGSTTAVSCCGANPGMVSWFVKKALLDIARDTKTAIKEPKTAPSRDADLLGIAAAHGIPVRKASHG